jgi:hypothetical protein
VEKGRKKGEKGEKSDGRKIFNTHLLETCKLGVKGRKN